MKALDWKKQWRGAGIASFVLSVVAFVFYGDQPKLGASTDQLVSFFDGDRTRILIATVTFCFAFLELIWFGAALSSVLREAGMGGWGAAATAAGAAMGAISQLVVFVWVSVMSVVLLRRLAPARTPARVAIPAA